MYEESVRTPLFMKFPQEEQRKHCTIDVPVNSIDIVPTLCDYLGLQAPADVSGISLMPLLEGEKQESARPVYIQYDGNGSSSNFSRCVIDDGYKLIVDWFKDEIF